MTRWWTVLGLLALAACAGPVTDDAASNDDALTATTSATPEDYATWADKLGAQGVTISKTGATVIGVRSPNTRIAQKFDDTLVVLTADKKATSFHASTHPWFPRNAGATDVDGDGVGDVGMLRPGSYRAKINGTHYGAPKFAVSLPNGNGSLPGWRNTNGDDQYEDSEIAASESRGDLLTDIRVHAAGPGSLAPIGCQVMAPADMNAVAKLVGSSFDYVLIDAD